MYRCIELFVLCVHEETFVHKLQSRSIDQIWGSIEPGNLWCREGRSTQCSFLRRIIEFCSLPNHSDHPPCMPFKSKVNQIPQSLNVSKSALFPRMYGFPITWWEKSISGFSLFQPRSVGGFKWPRLGAVGKAGGAQALRQTFCPVHFSASARKTSVLSLATCDG